MSFVRIIEGLSVGVGYRLNRKRWPALREPHRSVRPASRRCTWSISSPPIPGFTTRPASDAITAGIPSRFFSINYFASSLPLIFLISSLLYIFVFTFFLIFFFSFNRSWVLSTFHACTLKKESNDMLSTYFQTKKYWGIKC